MKYSEDIKGKKEILDKLKDDYCKNDNELFWDMKQFLSAAFTEEVNIILYKYNTEEFKPFIDKLKSDNSFRSPIDKVRFYVANILNKDK